MSDFAVLRAVRNVAAFIVMVVTWMVLGMVYLEKFVPPFDRLEFVLMPWKKLYVTQPKESLQDSLGFMQSLLQASDRVANLSFLVMLMSFAIFTIYVTFVYQQRRRRILDNKLLMIKNLEIARRNEFIRYISATIGHEFKNNLGRIKRRIDLMDLPHDVRDRVNVNMEKLFADIDIFKKISDEREAGLIEFESVDLKAILEGMCRQYGDLATITCNLDTVALHTIYASSALLHTVFENILDNAVKYKKPGQHKAEVEIVSSLDVDGQRHYVSISFKDNGLGMDEQTADICFYEAKSVGDGWGQGLYFAKYVVGLHAGKIRVGKEYTRPGAGTEIIIKLPFVEESVSV